MRPLRYNLTPQQEAATVLLGGELPAPSLSDQFKRVNRVFGSGDIDALTPGVTGVTPWPSAAKSKKGFPFDKGAVRDALTSPVSEKAIGPQDPRQLHSTQPGLSRQGVEYYMGDEYNQTGRTFADQNNVGNTRPVVYHKGDGRNLLLSGHHRAGAALLRGEQFNAQHVFGD
jgi:hypothetical protein